MTRGTSARRRTAVVHRRADQPYGCLPEIKFSGPDPGDKVLPDRRTECDLVFRKRTVPDRNLTTTTSDFDTIVRLAP
ncbi:hypothetical protein GCM10009779_09700 [Polymorphospora rubra]|uniref:Uncharacterized protein n=1 Tax=Polymorphospora rubra TaxID=338584 RepID=A0A810MRZ9_9ACTN|nr:hypothetical protein Prubr_10080 [Polymorphospora rubra]